MAGKHTIRLLFALLFALPVQAQEKPPTISEHNRANWQAVGRIGILNKKGNGGCTGVLIAPDLVLTAAHCVVNRKTGRIRPFYRVQFMAGWHNGTHLGSASAADIEVHPDYDLTQLAQTNRVRMDYIPNDLALVRLKNALDIPPLPVAAPLGDKKLLNPTPVRLLAYRGDRPEILSDYDDCLAQKIGPELLGLNCAVVSGVSGSPVFMAGLQGWEVVGIVSSQVLGKGEVRALVAQADRGRLSAMKLAEQQQ
ncbi:V8-like Glu-specific endopeptidase [Litoreibacter meonggei]|uniref:V8-like Glu-specific endopeptidase n=2 Tax=Litoreibacter meonggei TaxID=1049199 RepID=A0A497X4T0_9RHOB|nr:V8-like Glu-specific endopeptidase [Litoreibacter meonggei]